MQVKTDCNGENGGCSKYGQCKRKDSQSKEWYAPVKKRKKFLVLETFSLNNIAVVPEAQTLSVTTSGGLFVLT